MKFVSVAVGGLARAYFRPARRPHLPDRRRDQRHRPGLGQAVPRGRGSRRRDGASARARSADARSTRCARPLSRHIDARARRWSSRKSRGCSSSPCRPSAAGSMSCCMSPGSAVAKFGDGPLHECSDEGWEHVMQINATGRVPDQPRTPCGSCSASRSTPPACGGPSSMWARSWTGRRRRLISARSPTPPARGPSGH